MSYKILVLDIDGTLTNSKKVITEKTKQMLLAAQKEGLILVLASGRPTYGVLPFIKELKLDEYGGYILSFNGGQVISCKTGEVLYRKELQRDRMKKVYEETKAHGVAILSYCEDSIVTEEPEDCYVVKESTINKMPIRKVPDFIEEITYPVTKCLVVGEGEHLAGVEVKMKEKFGEYFNIYRSEPFFLEIMPQNIDKAYSLNILLGRLGFTKEEMIAIGDGYNDISMIEFAGLGVAMENAQEAVKKAANVMTFSNDEDGVAHIVLKYILN